MIYSIYNYDDIHINQDIQNLYRDVFNAQIEDEFQWRFVQNPLGKAISVIVRPQSDDAVIGHFSVMPCRVNLKGEKIDALISMGLMVRDEYKGQGISSLMSKCLFQYFEGSKYGLIIGFPNENSFSMHINKMGYVHVRDYHFVNFSNLYNKSTKNYEELLSGFDKKVIMSSNEKFCLDRDSKYLDWRYKRNKYTAFASDNGEIFIITRFQDKIDIVYWSSTVTVQDIRDFVNFIYYRYKVHIVATWDTIKFDDKDCIISERNYHFCIKKLKDDITREIFHGDEWAWLMGDNELF